MTRNPTAKEVVAECEEFIRLLRPIVEGSDTWKFQSSASQNESSISEAIERANELYGRLYELLDTVGSDPGRVSQELDKLKGELHLLTIIHKLLLRHNSEAVGLESDDETWHAQRQDTASNLEESAQRHTPVPGLTYSEIAKLTSDLSPRAFNAYIYIARQSGGSTEPVRDSLSAMATAMGVIPLTVEKGLKEVKEKGYIEVESQPGKPSVYRLATPQTTSIRSYESLGGLPPYKGEPWADRLRSTMAYRSITGVDLARRSGLSHASISRYIQKIRLPRAPHAKRIARALLDPGLSEAYRAQKSP